MTTAQLILGAIVWLAIVFAAAFLGSRFLPDEWYRGLAKPSWNPPNTIFAPVWTLLYLLMAVAAWLVWSRHGVSGAFLPLALFILQLLLNAGWTWFFFGRHRPDLALVDILVLWIVLLATLISFWQLEALAGALLLPYLAWVSFASALNWVIWQKNH